MSDLDFTYAEAIQTYLSVFQIEKAIEVLYTQYQTVSYQERQMLDTCVLMLQYWKKNQKEILKKPDLVQKYWDEFPQILIPEIIWEFPQFLSILGRSFMKFALEKQTYSSIQDIPNTKHKVYFARSLMWTGHVKQTIESLKYLIQEYPHLPQPYSMISRMYFEIGEEMKSILFYQESLFMNPILLNLVDMGFGLASPIWESRNQYPFDMEIKDYEMFMHWLAILSLLKYTNMSPLYHYTVSQKELLESRMNLYYENYSHTKNVLDWLHFVRLFLYYRIHKSVDPQLWNSTSTYEKYFQEIAPTLWATIDTKTKIQEEQICPL